MTVYLVRHADAKSRAHWQGADIDRPLTKKGQRQAIGVRDLLAHGDIRRIRSSPAVRCTETVAPLASKAGVDVETTGALLEGADTEEALALVVEFAALKGDSVLCTHGDLVPELLRALTRNGLRSDDELRFAKGSTWVLEGRGGTLKSARYLPPPGDR